MESEARASAPGREVRFRTPILPRWVFAGIALALVATIFRASHTPGDVMASRVPSTLGNLLHFVVHGTLAILLLRALVPAPEGYLAPSAWPGWSGAGRWVVPLVVFHALGDEIHQHFVPGRSCSVYDIVADICGGLTVLLLPVVGARGRPRSYWPVVVTAALGVGAALGASGSRRPPGDAWLDLLLGSLTSALA